MAKKQTDSKLEVKEPSTAPDQTEKTTSSDHDSIARLAYSYWETRGSNGGSPEEDWLRAENELKASAKRAGPAK
jgi:hypothetical protein